MLGLQITANCWEGQGVPGEGGVSDGATQKGGKTGGCGWVASPVLRV